MGEAPHVASVGSATATVPDVLVSKGTRVRRLRWLRQAQPPGDVRLRWLRADAEEGERRDVVRRVLLAAEDRDLEQVEEGVAALVEHHVRHGAVDRVVARDPVLGGALYVLGPLRNIVEAVAEWGDTSKMELTFAPDDCWALRRGKVHWVEDTSIGLLCKHVHAPLPKGYICVPMMAQSEAVGILHLAQPEDAQMPEAKQGLAIAMAEHVAMALSNLRLNETLRSQSIRDQMTGLFNRSFMEESLELELRRAARTQHPLSVIMLSLDNFQLLNDSYGVDVGDSILRRTGMLLQGNVRKGDIACRFADQTFTLVLPNADYEVSKKRAEILLDQVRNLEVKNQSELVGRISASVGLAVFPENGQTVESLMRSAEAALTRARGSGGNQIVVAI